MPKKLFVIYAVFVVFILTTGMFAQNKFEGFSVVVEANVGGECPVSYLPSVNEGNSVEVFVAGTDQRVPATGLTACDGASLRGGNKAFINNEGQWCFTGAEPFYDVKLKNGNVFLWYPNSKAIGFYNVKDFRPVTRTAGATPQYSFNEPADYTKTIRNAIAYIAARQGGTLHFPDGDYIVGTLDGNRRDPAFQAITLPSGIVIEGASHNYSIPTTNLPAKRAASRIRLRNDKQAIFRVGGCTHNVVVRQIELLGNSALYGETRRSMVGTYGIEGMGKWIIRPNGQQETNPALGFKVENVTFQNFERGLYVHNANDENCNPREQACHSWQFDYATVDQCMFLNNGTGIWINTYNTEWMITNTYIAHPTSNPPGIGIRLQKAGMVQIEQTVGGGYDYDKNIGDTFLYIDTAVSVTVISSGSERSRRSIFTDPVSSVSSMMVNVMGSVFGDPVDLNGRFNYVSTGNFYLARTVNAAPSVTITSVNDRYCYDSQVLPGRCTDRAGRPVANPGIVGGRRMFETGSVGEDTGPNRIEGRPNFFGYNVQIGDGLLQMDPNITFRDINAWAAGAGTRPKAQDGALVYCKDCTKSGNGTCTAGGQGAFAKRINGQWRCD